MPFRRTIIGVAVLLILPFGPAALAAPAPTGAVQPDPALAFLPEGTKIDWAAVNRTRAAKLAQRAQQQQAAALSQSAKPAPLPYAEHEAVGVHGVNDTPETAEAVAGFGTRKGKNPRAALSGDLSADDNDVYAVDLRAGDVLGASVAGGAKHLSIRDAGREVMGSSQDATYIYPAQSPLPGGGNAVADFVAPKDGRYTLGVQTGEGHYDVTLEVYRPGTETLPRNTVQTLFLDFDGARVNTAIFGGPGVRQLSPFASFLSGWGLGPADEDAVIDVVVATVRENFQRDLAAKGTNPRFGVRILNSRDDADPFGQPNVTRLVVGGTVAESGVATIGIAQSIDPGNFSHEETALILLDHLNAPAGGASSLNNYLTAASNKTRFVGQGIGNVVSHEAGHMSGSWHLDQFDTVDSLMDQGGNPAVMFGVGPDGVGGTADDPDVDFVEDTLNPNEGFTGVEDVLTRTAWAYSRGTA